MKKMRKKMIRKRRVVKNHQRILSVLVPDSDRKNSDFAHYVFKAA